jgi:hypothetical protein
MTDMAPPLAVLSSCPAMKVMLDREKDVAYVLLDDEWRENCDGWSQMFLPPDVPSRVDLFWYPDDRLEMIRIEQATKRLPKHALAAAVPFEPLE